MKKISLIYILLLSCCTVLSAQEQKKVLHAAYAKENIKIDGVLDESIWSKAEIATDFTEKSPTPNTPSAYKTEVKVVYSDESIYIGAVLHDISSDSVLRQFSVRDVSNVNADRFEVLIDGMYTQQNNFLFGITAAGVQYDASNGAYVWDAVWKSNVTVTDKGWVVEIEIPYSQLRFPRQKEQVWGLNFSRIVRRTREQSFWSKIDPKMGNEIQQYGLLKGINNVKVPPRLSLTPYVAGYLNNVQNGNGTSNWSRNFSAGADLKYGISESFTLDMTLIPDFGDVQSDNLLFNLSPFEVFYAERRPFFTEGVELFNRGGIFYSRRVGNRPTRYSRAGDSLQLNEEITNNPSRTQLINALKVSGRTKKGLGIGVFNAVTAPAFATITDTATNESRTFTTEPYTNYNMWVLDQRLGENSYVSLVNSSVVRFGDFTDALVFGTEFKIADKKNLYGVTGKGSFSYRMLDKIYASTPTQTGGLYDIAFKKFSGRSRFSIGQKLVSEAYNINDLGFVTTTNYTNNYAEYIYYMFRPYGYFLSMRTSIRGTLETRVLPFEYTRTSLEGRWSSTLRNFLSLGGDAKIEPTGFRNYFESRNPNRVWAKPTWTRAAAWFSSDYRKVFALDGNISYRKFWGQGAWEGSDVFEFNLQPLVRASNKLNFNISNTIAYRRNNIGYVATETTQDATDKIIFGRRYRRDLTTLLETNYLFNNKMALSFRVRHYWALVDYNGFYELGLDGSLTEDAYTGDHNVNYNAFNIDLIYRWQFAPGSELSIVWKNAVSENTGLPEYNYFQNVQDMFNNGQRNQFSIKALYYLDYFKVRNKLKSL